VRNDVFVELSLQVQSFVPNSRSVVIPPIVEVWLLSQYYIELIASATHTNPPLSANSGAIAQYTGVYAPSGGLRNNFFITYTIILGNGKSLKISVATLKDYQKKTVPPPG
jgi:hypothetical protein